MSDDRAESFDPAELEADIDACRAMIPAVMSSPDPRDAQLSALQSRVEADRSGDTGLGGRLRALSTSRRILLVMTVVVLVTAVAFVTTPRPDLAHYPAARMALSLGLLVAVTGAAAWRLLRPLHLPPPGVWTSRALLVIGVLTPCVLALVPIHHPGAPAGEGVAFAAACGKCLGFGAALGLPVLFLAFWARRARIDGAAVAALGGVAAGLTGNLTLQVHCPITESTHLLLGHAGLLVVLGAVAARWQR